MEIANLADEGMLRPVVDEVFPLAEVRRAVSLPLLAAGGIRDPASARAALASGALAVVMDPIRGNRGI